MKILIVDDEFYIRKLLSSILVNWGYEVFEANNSNDAFEIINSTEINFLITDWLMEETTGIELCRKIRETDFHRYVYIIFLTSKNNKDELIEGLDAGADDFISKPFNTEELKVKIRAGERILNLESQLMEKNHNLEKAYEQINNDLKSTSKLQKSILPAKFDIISTNRNNKEQLSRNKINKMDFEWIYLPSAILSGDVFNIFRLDENHIGLYHLDVAGHGIPASIMSVILSRMLLPYQSNYLKRPKTEHPFYEIVSPEKLFKSLNDYFCQEKDSATQYFTIVYMVLDIRDGKATYCAAGHTSTLIMRKDGDIELLDGTGFPIGLIEDADYNEFNIELEKGDKIVFYSDGVTECENNINELFSEERLIDFFNNSKSLDIEQLLSNLKSILLEWNGSDNFEDDLSLLAVELQ